MSFTRNEKISIGVAVGAYAVFCAMMWSAAGKAERTPAAVEPERIIALPRPIPARPINQGPGNIPKPVGSVLVLNARNTYVFRGVVSETSVAQAQQALIAMSNKLDADETIYLALDTPGGDVIAGNQLIDTVRGLPQKVKTVTIFAASMGFHFAQNMDERLITPSGVLMSHRATIGLKGEIPGEFLTRVNFFLRTMTRMDGVAAMRMGLELGTYQELIRDEYWVEGDDAATAKAADRVVVIRCDADMMATETVKLQTMFGDLDVTFSKCPLITGPVAINASSLVFPNEETKRQFNRQLDTLFNDKKGFVKLYVKTNAYEQYFR